MPADRLEQPELELDAEPVAPAALADLQLLGVAVGRGARRGVPADRPAGRSRRRRSPALGAAGPDQVRRDRCRLAVARPEPDDVLALAGLRRGVGRVERRGAQAAAEVGDAHAREHPAADRVGRIRAGAAEHGRVPAGRLEELPDRRAAAEVHGLRAAGRRSSARNGSGPRSGR